jgi:hypothetical protein
MGLFIIAYTARYDVILTGAFVVPIIWQYITENVKPTNICRHYKCPSYYDVIACGVRNDKKSHGRAVKCQL